MTHVPPVDHARASQVFTLADLRILGFAEYGDPEGVPIVFLHGSPECRLGLQPIHAPAFRNGIRAICPDRPGLGLSTPRCKDQPGYGSPLLAHADDIAALAAHLGIQQQWAVVGISGGGPYALACAHRASRSRSGSPEDAPYSDSDRQGDGSEAWRGLKAVASVVGIAPPGVAGVSGMFRTVQVVNLVIRWIPGIAGWIFGPVARLTRNPDTRPLRKYMANLEGILPAEDVAAMKDSESQDNLVATARETYRQGWEGPSADLQTLLKGFKDKKTGRWGWGFNVEDIDFEGADGQGVRLCYGTRDRNVPTSHGRALEKMLKRSRYAEYQETHVGVVFNRGDDILKEIRAAMLL